MNSELLNGILKAINSNLENRAILYYNGLKWCSATYEELNGYLNSLEDVLQDLKSTEWTTVLLYLKITWSYPVLVLGVLKAHLSFVCVGEDDKELLSYYFANMKVDCILSNLELRDAVIYEPHFFLSRKTITVFGDVIRIWETKASFTKDQEQGTLFSIKTSGTTGISKLIHVPHCSVFPNVADLSKLLHISNRDSLLLGTPVTFDPSVIELFLALYNGCSMCILEKNIRGDPHKVLDLLFSSGGEHVSILQTTPSLLRCWRATDLREKVLSRKSSLRALLLGGEEFPTIEEISSWNISEHISVFNIYGITEVSCWASINKVLPSKNPSNHIGKPLSETLFKLHGEDKNYGELLIGSRTRKCLVGYEKYGQVFKDGEELFRSTGDVFKKIDDKLFFVGRKDDIVKRWGTRFSLSEVDRVAKNHENTLESCCVGINFGSHYRIGLFVVQKVSTPLEHLKTFLRKSLPHSAWPDQIVILPSLPLTTHGKVCRIKLKELCSDIRGKSREQLLNDLWGAYTDNDSEDCSFISAGGNSFTALQLFNELKLNFPDIPDSFLGALMQNKKKSELSEIIVGLSTNEKECRDFRAGKLSPILNEKSGIKTDSDTHTYRTYQKGRISYLSADAHHLNSLNGTELKEVWKYNLGKCVDASPMGINFKDKDLVIVGSHSGLVIVLDISNQEVISKCTLPDRIESSACISPNLNEYYIGCYDGFLYCINVNSGKVLWKFQTGDMVKSTSVVYKGTIIFGSYDCCMYCLDQEGHFLWKTKLKSPILTEALVDGGNVYSATLGSIAVLLAETGQLIFEINSLPFFSTPALNAGNLIVAEVKGKVMWLNTKTGIEEHSFSCGDLIFSSIVHVHSIDEIILFGCHDANLYCLKNQKLFWKTPLDSKIVATPFVEIYDSASTSGFIICCSSSGKVFMLDLQSGNKLCDYFLPGEVFSSPVVIDQKIIVGCRDDNVYILKINKNKI